MEKDYKIIILLLVIIIAILAIGLAFITIQKEECKLTIKCNDTMYDGEKVKIRLTDLNKTPIANQTIHVKLISGNNTKEHDITTNSKGIGTLALNDIESGNYIINCSFDGNNHYNSANSNKKFNFDKVASATITYVDPIDANRPVNNPNYKGYTPLHESEVTSDGWNPNDHEVSRKTLADGNQEIRYDDGYYRLVDSNGYVITYGYRWKWI